MLYGKQNFRHTRTMMSTKKIKKLRKGFFILTTSETLISGFKTKVTAERFAKENNLNQEDTLIYAGKKIEKIALGMFWLGFRGGLSTSWDLTWKTKEAWVKELSSKKD